MTMKLGTQTGSFFNHLMSSNDTRPVAGEGCTALHWSDRHAYDVLWVSENGKRAKIRRSKATRTDGLGMSDGQQYEYTEDPTYPVEEIAFKWGYWRWVPSNSKANFLFGVRREYYDYSF